MKKKNPLLPPVSAPLRIGEKIGISLDGEHLHPTLLEDLAAGNRLVVSAPLYRGRPIIMKTGQQAQLFFFRENGRFCIDVQVEETFQQGELRLITLLPLSEPLKQQRRDSFRLCISLAALIRPYEGKAGITEPWGEEEEIAPWENVLTNNLSENGVSLNSIMPYGTGDCLHIKITLDHAPDHLEQIELLGLVRQIRALKYVGMQYRLGIEFLPSAKNLRPLIAKFVLKKQQQILRSELDLEAAP